MGGRERVDLEVVTEVVRIKNAGICVGANVVHTRLEMSFLLRIERQDE
jgi:hypothetical protein